MNLSHATDESMSATAEDASTHIDSSGVGKSLINSDKLQSGELQSKEEEQNERTTKQQRELLDEKLKNYKQEKLKCKLPVDTQLLCCAKEELKIKKRLVKQMDIDRNVQKTWKECNEIWKNSPSL